MRTRRSVWWTPTGWSLVVVGVVVVAVAGGGAPVVASPGPVGPGSTRTVECPIAVPDTVEVDCGELQVPEDPGDPDGRQVWLPYAILRTQHPDPEPDPVVFTAGGPGYSSLDSVWGFAESALLDERDIIVFEQRGNRYAMPALMCDPSVWWEETSGRTACLDRLRSQGIDLARYSTVDIARDLVALRRALGHDAWNLYGVSYSTSVMLLAMVADSDGVRSAVLESVKPPAETTFAHQADSPLRAIDRMVADCEADERCAAAYPDLGTDLVDLVRRLNDRPLEIEIEIVGQAQPVPITMDGHQFLNWIVIDWLYQPAFPGHRAAYLPLLVSEALVGNQRPLELAAQDHWNASVGNPNVAWGLMFAINCQEEVPAAGPVRPPADLAASERLDGFARSETQVEICEAWDLEPSGAVATEYVRSDVPALVLAGSYDPVTPPAWSRATAEHLSNGTYVEFSGHGHAVMTDNPCAAALHAAFVADPSRPLDTSCVGTTPGPDFVRPEEIYRAPGLARSADEVSLGAAGGVAWIEAVAAVGVYGSILFMAALVVVGIVWLVRHRRVTDRTGAIGYGLAWATALGVFAILVLTTAVNDDLPDGAAGWFGPARDLTSATLLAWVAPVVGLVFLAFAALVAWAWARGRWPLGYRLLTTAGSLCALAIVWLGLRWDLFTMLL